MTTTTHHLPSGEFAEVSPISGDPANGWQVIYWSSEADYLADKAEAGDWYDRATVSVACETREQALEELHSDGGE